MMQGDGVVSLLVSLSLLSGLVVGIRFNVRMLVWLCLGAIAVGTAAALFGPIAVSRSVLMTTVAIVALQVGYFVALVIGAMRLSEDPVPVREDVPAVKTRPETGRPSRA